MKKKLLNPCTMFMVGLCLGIVSRLLDIYTQNLGEIFSQMAVWILLGTLISIFSEIAKNAAFNILPFCFGMLIANYTVAIISHGVYGKTFIIRWTIFALCSPIMAYVAWMAKQRGIFPKIISVGIVAVSALSSILLFDGFRLYDFVIDGLLIYFLFFKKMKR